MAERPNIFMDDVHAWAFRGRVYERKATSAELKVMARYRTALRRAERFVVDDEAVRLCCRLNHDPERVKGWAFLARLPHDVCWFEFNLHEKVREFERMGTLVEPFDPSQVPDKMGILIYKDDPPSPLWIAHTFVSSRIGSNEVACDLTAVLFNPEGDEMWPVRGSKTWRSPTLSLRPGFPRIPITVKPGSKTVHTTCSPELTLGGAVGINHREGGFAAEVDRHGNYVCHDEDFITGLPWLTARSAVILDPLMEAGKPDFAIPRIRNHMITSINEMRGSMRWLVTLLAMINGLPIDTRPIVTRPGKRPVGMNMLPYFGHSTITIKVPRDDRVMWARKALDTAGRNSARRWGPVRGHWRVVERGKSTHVCHHMPVMVEAGLGMCEACELLVRWIEFPHGRGDPTVGIVERAGYTVEGRDDRLHRGQTP